MLPHFAHFVVPESNRVMWLLGFCPVETRLVAMFLVEFLSMASSPKDGLFRGHRDPILI